MPKATITLTAPPIPQGHGEHHNALIAWNQLLAGTGSLPGHSVTIDIEGLGAVEFTPDGPAVSSPSPGGALVVTQTGSAEPVTDLG
jgi:hypothetical protein